MLTSVFRIAIHLIEWTFYWNLIGWTFFSVSDAYQPGYEHIELEHKDAAHSQQDLSNASIGSSSTWQTQSSRIQSMVVQNDGSIILCENDQEIARSRPRIEVVEILSPTNYIRGKQTKQNFSLVTFHNKKKTANKTATFIVFVLAFFHHLIFAPFLPIHLQLSKRCTSIKWPRNRTMTRKLCHLNRMDTSRLQQLLCQRPAKRNQVQWKSDHCICNRNKRIAKCNATNVHDAARIIHNVKICDDIIGWNVGKSRNIRALCAIYDLNVIIKWVVICWRGMASKMPTIKCFCRMVMLLNFDSNRRRREKNRQTTKECFFVSHKKKWLCYKVST